MFSKCAWLLCKLEKWLDCCIVVVVFLCSLLKASLQFFFFSFFLFFLSWSFISWKFLRLAFELVVESTLRRRRRHPTVYSLANKNFDRKSIKEVAAADAVSALRVLNALWCELRAEKKKSCSLLPASFCPFFFYIRVNQAQAEHKFPTPPCSQLVTSVSLKKSPISRSLEAVGGRSDREKSCKSDTKTPTHSLTDIQQEDRRDAAESRPKCHKKCRRS